MGDKIWWWHYVEYSPAQLEIDHNYLQSTKDTKKCVAMVKFWYIYGDSFGEELPQYKKTQQKLNKMH